MNAIERFFYNIRHQGVSGYLGIVAKYFESSQVYFAIL